MKPLTENEIMQIYKILLIDNEEKRKSFSIFKIKNNYSSNNPNIIISDNTIVTEDANGKLERCSR